MLSLLPIWLALFCILTGWGLLLIWALRRLGGAAFGGVLSAFQTLWLGYAGLLAFLQLCSFVLPIAELALVLSLGPTLAGFVLQRHVVRRWLRGFRARDRRLLAVTACVVALACLVVDWSCCNAVNWYDTGLYHYAAVKWFATYPVVPGLANLHLRFGYNNSVHVFGAYVDVFWQGVAVHAMNGFFVAVLLSQWFVEIFTGRGPRGRLRQVFCLLTLPFLLAKLWTIEMASLSSDLALAVFCFVLVLELLSLHSDARQRFLLPLTVILALGAVAVSTKLGGLALFGVVSLLALYLVRRDVTWRARMLIFTLPVLVLGGWMARGVVLSGWLIFPVFGRLPLTWSVRPKVALDHLREIQSWGRIFGKGPAEVFANGFWGWFPVWFETFRGSRELSLLIASIAAFTWRVATAPIRLAVRHSAQWAAIGACALGILQWFLGAPDLRYGGFLFWLLAAVLVAPPLSRAMRDPTPRSFVLVMSLALSYWSGGFGVQLGLPPPLFDRPPDPPAATIIPIEAGPGTTLYFPTTSDQCWDSDLLCTPAPDKQTLRDPSSVAAGFLAKPRKNKQ
jgi:hypothetical protein